MGEPAQKPVKPVQNRFALRNVVAPESVQFTTTLDLYFDEHQHRTPVFVGQVEQTITDLLDTVGLEARQPIRLLTKPLCRHWKDKLLASGISPQTVARKLGIVHHWLKWCLRQDYIETVPTEGLQLPARMVRDSKKIKRSFEPTDLASILNDPFLVKKKTSTNARDREVYWIVMMLAFSGARCGEVVQLLCSDIRQEEGIWYMNLENDPDNNKRVKNRFSVRQVPLHSGLLKLGLLEYMQSIKTGKLFPFMIQTSQPSASVSISFRYVRDRKIDGGKGKADRSRSLHSLRHSMAVTLKKARVDDGIRHKILGHAQGSSVEDRVYLEGLSYSLGELQTALEMVTLPVNLDVHHGKSTSIVSKP
jgi:integrase